MIHLLDVNVLIALIDPRHVAHDLAHGWFGDVGSAGWATCPLTENGVIRILGNPKYPNSPGSPAPVADIVERLRRHQGHHFWSDDFSIVDNVEIDATRLLTSAQVTDTYLLGLAKRKGGCLATLDRRLVTSAVHDGKSALHVIGGM